MNAGQQNVFGRRLCLAFHSKCSQLLALVLFLLSVAFFFCSISSRKRCALLSSPTYLVSAHRQTRRTLIRPQLKLSIAGVKGITKPVRCANYLLPFDEVELQHQVMLEEQTRYWDGVMQLYSGVAGHAQECFEQYTSLMIHGLLPTYTCPVHRRYGGIPDGGKTMCDPECIIPKTQPSCLVYSFGVGQTCSFEHQVWTEHPNCEIHLFDPTPSVVRSSSKICPTLELSRRLQFHPWGLGGYQTSLNIEGKTVELLSLGATMSRLGHSGRTLDVFKFDVEGSEYDALRYSFDKKEMPAINLLLFEGHMGGPPNLTVPVAFRQTMTRLESAGFRLYHTERNPYGSWADFEAAFVNKTALQMSYSAKEL